MPNDDKREVMKDIKFITHSVGIALVFGMFYMAVRLVEIYGADRLSIFVEDDQNRSLIAAFGISGFALGFGCWVIFSICKDLIDWFGSRSNGIKKERG